MRRSPAQATGYGFEAGRLEGMGWLNRGGVGKARPHALSSVRSGPRLMQALAGTSWLHRLVSLAGALTLRCSAAGVAPRCARVGACLAPSAAACEGRLQAL